MSAEAIAEIEVEPLSFGGFSPQLWPRNRRFVVVNVILDSCVLLGGFILILITRQRVKKLKPGTPGLGQLKGVRRFIRTLSQIFALDAFLTLIKGPLGLIAARRLFPITVTVQAYNSVTFTSKMLSCAIHIGYIFFISKLNHFFWNEPGHTRPIFGYAFIQFVFGMGFIFSFGLANLRFALFITTQLQVFGYPTPQEQLNFADVIVFEDMQKLAVFFALFLLILPHHGRFGGPWMLANLIFTIAAATYRFTRVMQNRGVDELTPHWISLFVDLFYSRLPTLFLLIGFARMLFSS